MGRFTIPSLPDPAIEEEIGRSQAMRDARCLDCGRFRHIPREHGDPNYGYCRAHDDWFDGMDKVLETGCEQFEWRKWW